MRFFPVISVVTLLLGWAAPAAAQEPVELSLASTVAPGTRVRVVSTSVQAVSGVVMAADETAITLVREDGPPLKVPMRSIVGMDMSIGRKRQWLTGLAIGAVTGVAMGFAVPVEPEYCGYYSNSNSYCSRGGAVAGSVLGLGLLGTGIGALIKTDRWAPIVSPGASTRGAARGRSVQAGVAVQF
jgi:hypothetical protein